MARSKPGTDRTLDARLCAWFRKSARDLAWRRIDPALGRRNPYWSLVSEFMLQQTQVARVIEKFGLFIARFPTVEVLAAARLDDVLAEWSGLGYYRRARHLHAAAKVIVGEFGGVVPRDVAALLRLPGVGRYTAGAIASMVYGEPAPIVDGNVARVLLRVRGKQLGQQEGMAYTWKEAERLAAGSRDIAAFNEGLMELGATVCTPVNPRCGLCPIAKLCGANKQGLQEVIPAPKKRAERTSVTHSCVVVRDGRGRVLLEKRPATGLWADMWQPPTLESARRPSARRLAAWLAVERVVRVTSFVHNTSHRSVEFVVYDAGVQRVQEDGRRWFSASQVKKLALGNAQLRVLGAV